MRPPVGAALCLVAACGGPLIRGAVAVPAGQEPRGRLVQAYEPSDCRDAKGGSVGYPALLYLVDTGEHELVVESRPGYDSLVIHDGGWDGAEVVFQAFVGGTRREVRLPRSGASGTMLVALGREPVPALQCRLRPVAL